MTRKKILKHLIEWESVQKALDVQLNQLYTLTLCQPDGPLLDAIYAVTGAYTEAVSLIVGDNNEWLNWWRYETEFGARPMEAANLNEALREITTLNELVGLISG